MKHHVRQIAPCALFDDLKASNRGMITRLSTTQKPRVFISRLGAFEVIKSGWI
jgi:hypothetical protein